MNTEGVMSVAKNGLTAKEKKFCRFIADGENQTQAAILAGYSKENAASIASKTIKKPKVQAFLAELEREICRNIGLSPELIGGRLEKQYQHRKKDACICKRVLNYPVENLLQYPVYIHIYTDMRHIQNGGKDCGNQD